MIENPPHAVTIQNRGLWRVAIGFTDFKSGNYRSAQFCAYLIHSALRFQIGILPPGLFHNFRVGANQLPLCSFQKRKAASIPPRKIGAMSVQAQICSRKIPGTGRAALCFGNGYFRGTPDKRMRGQQSGSFHNHITINVCLALESCCQMCYIKHRKRESHRSGYPQQ